MFRYVHGMHYFGYGSNMNLPHLEAWIRNGGGDPMGITNPRHARLHDYGLRTNYRSARHGAGAANIEPASGQVVEGVLMHVTPAVHELLRRKEGWPKIYAEVTVTVVVADDGAAVEALTYIVTDPHLVSTDLPVTPEYAGYILAGAAAFNFPSAYQQFLHELLQTTAPSSDRDAGM